jgi:hypothetical protein
MILLSLSLMEARTLCIWRDSVLYSSIGEIRSTGSASTTGGHSEVAGEAEAGPEPPEEASPTSGRVAIVEVSPISGRHVPKEVASPTSGGQVAVEASPTSGEQVAVEAVLGAGEASCTVLTANTDDDDNSAVAVLDSVVDPAAAGAVVDDAEAGPVNAVGNGTAVVVVVRSCSLLVLLWLGRTDRPVVGTTVLLYTGICFCRNDSSRSEYWRDMPETRVELVPGPDRTRDENCLRLFSSGCFAIPPPPTPPLFSMSSRGSLCVLLRTMAATRA